MTDDLRELDRIERSIDIDAPAGKVWGLVTRVGWWINTGRQIRDDLPTATAGERVTVANDHGEFAIEAVRVEPTTYVAYRWFFPDDEVGTLVEFSLEERGAGVTLRVVESGFASLDKSRERIVSHVADNTSGWEQELGLAAEVIVGAAA